MASPSSLIPAEGQPNNPSPQPPPRSGEGGQEPLSSPPRIDEWSLGEGAGGRGLEPSSDRARDVLLVGGPDPVAADYLRHASGGGCGVRSFVVFLKPRLTDKDRAELDALIRQAAERSVQFVGVVSSFRVHLGDRGAVAAEEYMLGRLKGLPARCVVFRPGYILSPGSRPSAWLRRFGSCYPLVPRRLRSCCVEGEELFASIESERRASGPNRRVLTLLGPNRPWKDVLAQHRARGPVRACLTVVSALLALLLVGQFAALVLTFLARRRPALRRWNFDTLRPASLRELLALYNPYNYRHVKVVGYNNGVIHFGQKFPGKTVVSTVRCNRVVRTGSDVIKADCGATIRKALDFVADAGQELYVIPNYSYVCLGTAFFIPIHGSAADYSTVAETITSVVLYDPVSDRLLAATRDEPAFREHVYNLKSDVLLLRLRIRVKPKSKYYVRREERDNPGSAELLADLRDTRATNVEIRKASAAGSSVRVNKYYNDPGTADSPVLELPRDALGRVWDRMEENAFTSFILHALTRYFAWHVELFFTAEEFATFWETHRTVPLRKIQLRYIRRDGFPHSPFRDHDCVSADMFMLRRHRRHFEEYLKRTFTTVRANPGKHSG